jgi:hypothetical protein
LFGRAAYHSRSKVSTQHRLRPAVDSESLTHQQVGVTSLCAAKLLLSHSRSCRQM